MTPIFRLLCRGGLALSLIFSNSIGSAEPAKRRLITKYIPGAREIFQYFDDVDSTNGRRIISRPADKSVLPSPRSIWFNTPSGTRGLPMRAIQFIPMKITEKWPGGPYEFTPIRTLESLTWGRYTERAFGVREEFSAPVRIVTFIAFAGLIYAGLTHGMTHETAKSLFRYLDAHKDFYDFFLTYDYRCRDILDDYLKGELSALEARFNVYQMQLIYLRWFKSRGLNIHRPPEYLRKKLIDFPIFLPLKEIVDKGLKPSESFDIDKRYLGPISDEQVEALFSQQDELAVKEEYITRFAHAPFNFENSIDPNFFTTDLKAEIADDPVTQELLRLRAADQISVGHLVLGLQENETWKTEFEHYATLHMQPVDKKTHAPLSLGDIQQRNKANVLRRASNPLEIE